MMHSDGEQGRLLPASLIIASRNRPALLSEAVDSILHGIHLPSEVIIIDQSDRPHPQLSLQAGHSPCELRYEWVKYTGLSRANNAGIRAARNNIVVFTHDDVLVARDWFGNIVRELEALGSRAVITGRVLVGDPETAGAFVATFHADQEPEVYEGRVWQDVVCPLNLALFRSAVEDVGGFDERLGPGTLFPGAEDNDLGFRLLEAGYRVAYAPGAVLYHRAWRTDYLSLRWSYGRAQGAFYAKYFGLHDRYTLRRMSKEITHRTRRLLHRRTSEVRLALGDAIYILGLLCGAGHWLTKY